MAFEESQLAAHTTHATLVFEREVPATVERVFEAFASARSRSNWGAPSDTAIIIYDQDDFREGGEDRFRCGSKSNPNIFVSVRQSHVESSAVIWHRPHEGDRGDYESSVDSGAPSAA